MGTGKYNIFLNQLLLDIARPVWVGAEVTNIDIKLQTVIRFMNKDYLDLAMEQYEKIILFADERTQGYLHMHYNKTGCLQALLTQKLRDPRSGEG